MRIKLSLTGGKGINLDAPPADLAPGYWSNMINMRARAGMDELWEGAYLQYSSGSVVPKWGLPYSSAIRYAVWCSTTKVYAFSTGSTNTEITRGADGMVVSNMTASGTTVTVTTLTDHGLTAASSVIDVFGTVPTSYNIDGVTVATTPTSKTFTYVVPAAPAVSPATVLGAYSGNSASNFVALTDSQRYTGGSFNGVFLFNHPDAGLYYWSGVDYLLDETAGFLVNESGNRLIGGGSLRVRKIPGFSGTWHWNTATAVRPFKKYIVVLGQVENGIVKRQNVRWSASISDSGSLPTEWTSTDTNDAGETNLTETAGSMVDCLPLGEANIIYLSDARYAMQYVGGVEVFSFTRLPGRQGLLAPNCVVQTPLGHVFLTPDMDVMIHNGGEPRSIAANKVRQYLRDNAAPAYAASLSFLAVNHDKHEVIVCFAKNNGASTVCDTALTWNWVDDTWGKLDLTSNATSASGLAFAADGLWPNLSTFENTESIGYFCYHATTAANTGIYYTVESTAGRWFETDLAGTLERTGIDAGDRDVMKCIHRSRWVIDASGTTTATISHGASSFSDTAPTYATGVTYTVGTTDYCNARSTQGRYLAVKLVTATVGTTPLRVRSVDLDIATGGKR